MRTFSLCFSYANVRCKTGFCKRPVSRRMLIKIRHLFSLRFRCEKKISKEAVWIAAFAAQSHAWIAVGIFTARIRERERERALVGVLKGDLRNLRPRTVLGINLSYLLNWPSWMVISCAKYTEHPAFTRKTLNVRGNPSFRSQTCKIDSFSFVFRSHAKSTVDLLF